MKRLQRLATAVAIVALSACGNHVAGPAGSSTTAVTTTGISPSGVPTEGTRPPTDGLGPAAEPHNAAPQNGPVPGRIVSVGQGPEGVVVDAKTRTVVIATRNPNELVLLNADTGAVTGRTRLPGSARHLQLAAPGGPVLVPVETANALVSVDLPQGNSQPAVITGSAPHDAAAASNGTVFVSNELGGTVVALRDQQIVKVFTDSVQPAGLAAVGTSIGMLDVRQNVLTIYDADRLKIIGSTPAGAGPTHLVADRHGRMIAADTRGDALRVFAPLPAPRELASVAQPGGPYGIAYDETNDRLWVASSGDNEVIEYDMTEATPKKVRRLPTVQNPYSLGVDAQSGRVFIAGATGEVVQIVDIPN